jgi:dihydroorotase
LEEDLTMPDTILIKNGRVISPADKLDKECSVLIADGKISSIGCSDTVKADKTIDAKGCWVLPGLIDLHVHFREPGREDKETIKTGSAAAAAGGFTAVATMPNTTPVVDNETVVKFILDRAKEGSVRVYPVGAITKGQEGVSLAEIGLMRKAGIVAISEDGKSVMNSGLMKSALRYSLMDDTLVICHCEDHSLSGSGVVHAGRVANMLGLKGIPRSAEEIMTSRDIMLAKETGARIHIAHVSTKGAVDIIRRAKEDGVKVTCETAPHYITLTDSVVESFNPNYKVNPPLREESDIEALMKGLMDGTIDAIATDHAPHTVDEKDQEYDQAPNGMIGLETAFGVMMTRMVHSGKITPSKLVELMSLNPAKILRVDGGTIKEGASADIAIVKPTEKWVVDAAKFKSKARNTPFNGMELTGKPFVTIVDGQIV